MAELGSKVLICLLKHTVEDYFPLGQEEIWLFTTIALSAGVWANNPALAVRGLPYCSSRAGRLLCEISAGRVWSHGRRLEPGEKLYLLNGRGECFHHSRVSELFTAEASGTTPTFRRRTRKRAGACVTTPVSVLA